MFSLSSCYIISFVFCGCASTVAGVYIANSQAHFKVHMKEGKVDLRQVRAEVRSPSLTPVECKLQLNQAGGSGTFVPVEIGMHAVSVPCL